jgi:hypothetical protein
MSASHSAQIDLNTIHTTLEEIDVLTGEHVRLRGAPDRATSDSQKLDRIFGLSRAAIHSGAAVMAQLGDRSLPEFIRLNNALREIESLSDEHIVPIKLRGADRTTVNVYKLDETARLSRAALHDLMKVMPELRGLLSMSPFASSESLPRKSPGLLHFGSDELSGIMDHWDVLQPTQTMHNADGIRLKVKGGSEITITHDRVYVDASNDEAARALVLHAKKFWNGNFYPAFEGKEDEKARVWAHAQVHGAKFGWEPSPELARRLQPEIARLRVIEATRNADVDAVAQVATRSPRRGTNIAPQQPRP